MAELRAIVRFVARSSKRVAVTVLGFVLLLAGLVMLIGPGPGLVVVIAGLAVLGTEYTWASRALEEARRRAAQARRRAARARRREPRRGESAPAGTEAPEEDASP